MSSLASRVSLWPSDKLPLIRQTEAAECGLACLAMVASAHGHDTDLLTLRRRFEMSSRGATLGRLMQIADQMGLANRALRLELEELPELRTPCLLHEGIVANGIGCTHSFFYVSWLDTVGINTRPHAGKAICL